MSRFKITINNSLIDKLKLNPLFFLRYDQSSYYSYRDKVEVDTSTWVSVDKELKIKLEAQKVDLEAKYDRCYYLCFVELETQEPHVNSENQVSDFYSDFKVHTVSVSNKVDLKQVFDTYIYHAQRPEMKYAFVELLWLLEQQQIDADTMKTVIGQYDKNSIKWLCCGLADFGRCLSFHKQKKLQNVVYSFNEPYSIYTPVLVSNAFYRTGISEEYNQSNKNIFDAVDYILNPDNDINLNNALGNKLLELWKWLQTEEPFTDYSFIVNLLALVSEEVRFKMIKRWFHDIRLGNTTFDKELLLQFKDNKFDNFIRFRYCIETPCEPIVLTVPLLADNILTLHESGGRAFQDYDGVLDFAITHCDTSHPDIEFKMDRFIPRCNGGTQYNDGFVGFIDYAVIRRLDESKFDDAHVMSVIREILDRYAERKPYLACIWDERVPLNEEQLKNCLKKRELPEGSQSFNAPATYQFECCVTRHYEDKWLVKQRDDFDFNVLFGEKIELTRDATEIDASMISIAKFIEFLRLIPAQFTELGDGTFLVPSYRQRSLLLQLVEEFSTIERMRIIPNKNVIVGTNFDIFGIKKKLFKEKGEEAVNTSVKREEVINEYINLESIEVFNRVLKTLQANYKLGTYNEEENFFELPFDYNLLYDITKKFYFKRSVKENDDISARSFLAVNTRHFKPFCSPKLADAKNEVLDFPFFWCIGNECFSNCLGEQTLDETNNWHAYSLYHLIEIIGYKKLHMTDAGYEPDDQVRQFIAITNKVMQTFRRLKCRSCGHLLFTDRSSGFNRNNYYSCANTSCKEYHQPIYLSYCFKCKKGLIDSRDSKQCPNGWYICPTCLSCCDDAQYERQAQRYVVTNRPIPYWLQMKLGKGHNDKGIYYCPDCGTQIVPYQDDHGETHHGCPQCRKSYDFIY